MKLSFEESLSSIDHLANSNRSLVFSVDFNANLTPLGGFLPNKTPLYITLAITQALGNER